MENKIYPQFISNLPCGEDHTEGKSQERLAVAIAEHIISIDGKIIALLLQTTTTNKGRTFFILYYERIFRKLRTIFGLLQIGSGVVMDCLWHLLRKLKAY